ncbi:HEXXH motif-containing putative peptide modification protein [Brevundimonas sp. BR2-1]|uniref:aKG-HExxH-type peptide beta-hydroxylase n=1 Tax=Brevundimonas sp. BR2-1 TaxID=3031123 RepID=UPI003098D697
MGALLIGSEIDGAFTELHNGLQSATTEYARRKWACIVPEYGPWLCFAPLLDEIDPRLIYFRPPRRGHLVDDPDILAIMADFMAGDGRPAIAELPGEDTAWLPRPSDVAAVFRGAVDIIERSDAFTRRLYDQTVDYVVPLGGGRNRGFSTHLARGAVFRSLPEDNDAYDIAIDVIHEVGHQVLMTWQSIDPILTSDPAAPVYSEIRRVDRPAIQSFHAAVALAFMRRLERTHPGDPLMQAAGLRRGASYSGTLSGSLELALEVVRKACTFTEAGRQMIREMEAEV